MMSAEILGKHVIGRLNWGEDALADPVDDKFTDGVARSQVIWTWSSHPAQSKKCWPEEEIIATKWRWMEGYGWLEKIPFWPRVFYLELVGNYHGFCQKKLLFRFHQLVPPVAVPWLTSIWCSHMTRRWALWSSRWLSHFTLMKVENSDYVCLFIYLFFQS